MFNKAGMGNILKKAQEMQLKMQEAQEQIKKVEATGESGGGLVRLNLNGAGHVLKLSIDDAVMDDKDMLEDLIIAAHNNAKQKVDQAVEQMQAEVTGGLDLPPGMKLPF